MKEKNNTLGRREFLQTTAMVAGAFALTPFQAACAAAPGRKEGNRSDFGGVRIGAVAYSFRSLPSSAGDVLLYTLASGLGSLEMSGDIAEYYAGRPMAPQFGPQPRLEPGQQLTPAQKSEQNAIKAARQKYDEEVRAWRLSVPMSKYEQLGRVYRMAGVDIHILKLQPKENMSDAELDYVFNACKAVGAAGVSTELSLKLAERVAPFAEKHGKFLIFHNHGQFAKEDFPGYDAFLKFGDSVRFNFDMGHYYGYTGRDPREIVEKYHKHIFSIHLKDKTGPKSSPANSNTAFGEGETPLREFMLYIQRHAGKPGWPVHCDIELEYDIPEGSDAIIQTTRCVEWVKNVLANR